MKQQSTPMSLQKYRVQKPSDFLCSCSENKPKLTSAQPLILFKYLPCVDHYFNEGEAAIGSMLSGERGSRLGNHRFKLSVDHIITS